MLPRPHLDGMPCLSNIHHVTFTWSQQLHSICYENVAMYTGQMGNTTSNVTRC